jgi:alpha-L-fucosidase
MLGLAPDNRGLLPDSDVARLKEFGDAVRKRYGTNLMRTHTFEPAELEAAMDDNPDTFWTAPVGSHHAILEATFVKPITFDHAVTMEWLNDGQKVQKYAIEALTGGKWTTIAKGEAIGHKKIDAFAPVTASRVRLNILSSTSEASIKEFQLYSTGVGKAE